MQPKIYSIEEHRLSSDKVDSHAFYIIHKLREAGHKAFLVGGSVRDLLLDRKPKDYDISTSARPEEIRALFRNCILIGRRFRLAHIRFGKKIIEVSTFRAGETENAELIVRDNVWGSEEEDVLRRDFTINGLFYDPETQEIIDYVDGYIDIDKKILRTIGKPETRFSQDPVRMIRLIKFCARFDFEIEKPTFEALLSCKKEILKSSSARILEELLRMLESGSSRAFFHLLNEYGMLKALLPELAHYLQIHPENITFELLEQIDEEIKKHHSSFFDRSLLLTALIFPLFEQYLKIKIKNPNRPPHLGQITELAYHVIDGIFGHFFTLPRRLSSLIASLIATQYRLVPCDGKLPRKIRISKDLQFTDALHLLKWRAAAHPELLNFYTFWTKTVFLEHRGSSDATSSQHEQSTPS